jgi:diguanylate cyclase (GGDEF)-like protein/PAS domain S-box-containing protein
VTTFVMLRPLRRLEACAGVLARGDAPKDDEWPRVTGELGQLTHVLRDALQQRAAADAKGRELLQRLQAVMAHAPVGFAFTRDKHFEAVSVQFERLLGYPCGALDFTPARQIYASDAVYDALGARVASAFNAHRPLDEEVEFIRRDGRVFWGRLRGQPVQWGHPSGGTIWTLEDVTEQRRERQSLAWTSTHDALTGLANRAEFEHRLTDRLSERRDGEAALLFLDLDRFKAVNDSAGHAAGDAVLVETGRALERLVRHGDTVARIGGDEFAVLLSDCSLANALRVAEKMRAAVDALEVKFGTDTLRVGASIGVAEVQAGCADVASLLAAADAACYVVKRGGRNGVHLHGAADAEPAAEDALA